MRPQENSNNFRRDHLRFKLKARLCRNANYVWYTYAYTDAPFFDWSVHLLITSSLMSLESLRPTGRQIKSNHSGLQYAASIQGSLSCPNHNIYIYICVNWNDLSKDLDQENATPNMTVSWDYCKWRKVHRPRNEGRPWHVETSPTCHLSKKQPVLSVKASTILKQQSTFVVCGGIPPSTCTGCQEHVDPCNVRWQEDKHADERAHLG